jgi:subtilisin family serine protease
MTAGLDHVTWFMTSPLTPKPENAVAVFGHDVLWACRVARASPDPAVAAQVFAFEDALEGAQGADVLAIMPVGNFSLGDAPTIPNVVNVGASTLLVGACGLPTQTTRWIGSRWADTPTGPKPSLLAPGQSILAASQMGVYVRVTGTSFAAAHVAGVAAILRCVRPGKSALDIANMLKSSATALPLTPPTAARPAGTPDPQSGSGRLNGGGAVFLP